MKSLSSHYRRHLDLHDHGNLGRVEENFRTGLKESDLEGIWNDLGIIVQYLLMYMVRLFQMSLSY